MRFGWRAISGPVLTAAIALLAILLDRTIPLPSPAPVFVCVVALAGALSGFASAMTSAALAVIGAALFCLGHRAMINSIAATAEHSSLHGRERKKAVPSPVPGCDPTASLALAPDRLLRVEPVPDWT